MKRVLAYIGMLFVAVAAMLTGYATRTDWLAYGGAGLAFGAVITRVLFDAGKS